MSEPEFFMLGENVSVWVDHGDHEEELDYPADVVLVAQAHEDGSYGPMMLAAKGQEREVRAGPGRSAMSAWTWDVYEPHAAFTIDIPDADGEVIGELVRIEYDGLLAGDDARRYHNFGEPGPELMETPEGHQIRRGYWRGKVTDWGIVG